jgi:hypothetical protein
VRWILMIPPPCGCMPMQGVAQGGQDCPPYLDEGPLLEPTRFGAIPQNLGGGGGVFVIFSGFLI